MAANSIDHRGPCNLGLQANLPITLTDGMSEDAQLHKFDQLLIFKLDRLGRDTRLILNAVAELEKHGVRVRSMTEEFDTATSTGRLMLTMLSGFAAHERELIGSDQWPAATAWRRLAPGWVAWFPMAIASRANATHPGWRSVSSPFPAFPSVKWRSSAASTTCAPSKESPVRRSPTTSIK